MTDAGEVTLRALTARVSADAYGLHCRTLSLRRWSVPWRDVADLRVHRHAAKRGPAEDDRRVSVRLRDGRRRTLPLPYSLRHDDREFDAALDALCALHRCHGNPESRHVPVISHRTAGRGRMGLVALCVLLLAGAGLAARGVPGAASHERAWQAAVPCAAETPAAARGDCLSTVPAVIERTDAVSSRSERSKLHFAGGRPLEHAAVSREAALTFRPGDRVRLTFWRGGVRKVAGERYVWQEHVTGAGDVAVAAAGLLLAAGCPAAVLLARRRGRRLPDDEVLPSALPFAGALVGTALWLLPLVYLHPLGLPASPGAVAWAAAGSAVTLVLFTGAWRATRVRVPGEFADAGAAPHDDDTGEVFLTARFLDDTDYNPNGFGTHIALGGGPPAVTPGPARFAAKRIPVERLTVTQVRRARGDDGDTVSRSWHIAELDDAGRPVRLAAAPADLARILRALGAGPTPPPPPDARASSDRRPPPARSPSDA